MFIALVDLVSDLPKGEAGQLRYLSVVEAGDELLDLAAPLRCNDADSALKIAKEPISLKTAIGDAPV